LRQRLANHVHEDFGVRLPREIIVAVTEQFVSQHGVVRQLAIEGETEPLVFFDVMPFEGWA
jgi:hypothetical protein